MTNRTANVLAEITSQDMMVDVYDIHFHPFGGRSSSFRPDILPQGKTETPCKMLDDITRYTIQAYLKLFYACQQSPQ